MKYSTFGDDSKVFTEEGFKAPENSKAELLTCDDIISARTINRPIRNLQENNEDNYQLLQSLLKSVYGNFSGIVPNVYEEFSNFSFKKFSGSNQTYLRIPTGLIYGRGNWDDDHSYFTPEEKGYKDDLDKKLLTEDLSFSIFNRPNLNLFERNLAELIGLDLNDEDNNIKLNYKVVDKKIQYSIDIRYDGKSISIPSQKRSIKDNEEVVEETGISFESNSVDLFNDFVDSFSDIITISPANFPYYDSLEIFVPIFSDYVSSTYQLRYKFGDPIQANDVLTDFTGHFYIPQQASSYANSLDSIKIADIKNGEITLALPILDQRLIKTKRAELDTLLVNLRSDIYGDIFADNFKSTKDGLEINSDISAKGKSLSTDFTEASHKSEKESIDTNSLKISNAKISLEDSKGIEVIKDSQKILDISPDEIKEDEIVGTYKDKDLFKISDSNIEVGKSIVPNETNTLSLGSPTKRFKNIYADIEGSTTLAKILFNQDSNVIISNVSLEQNRLLKHDIGKKLLTDKSIVYHFDYNLKDANNQNDLIVAGNYTLEPASGDSDGTVIPYQPYESEGKYISGNSVLNISTPEIAVSGNDYSVDAWIKYTYASTLFSVKENKFTLDINNAAQEIDFYTDGVLKTEGQEITYIDSEGNEATTKPTKTVAFYKNAEYNYSITTKDGTYETTNEFYVNEPEDKFDVSGYGYFDASHVYQPYAFAKKSEAENILNLLINGTEYTLFINNKTIAYHYGEWIHLGISSTASEFKIFLNDTEVSISGEEFVRLSRPIASDTIAITVRLNTIGADELMIDPTVAYSLEDYNTFNSGDRLNWGTLDYSGKNFVLDLADTTQVFTNLFTSDAFKKAVTDIHNSLI